MDEAEKYKQRLEAIAEKRRLQEEQDRVKREMEDEKIRLQQLKRKSLRDQWLMEGAPLSPTSPDSPRSPLWGTPTQHSEGQRLDSQLITGEGEELKEERQDGENEAVTVTDEGSGESIKVNDMDEDGAVQNGENHATELGAGGDEMKANQKPRSDEEVHPLMNGGGSPDINSSDETKSTANETNKASEFVLGSNSENGVSLAAPEMDPDTVPHFSSDEAEGETLVMRAERVMISDEGDDGPEDLTQQDDQEQETIEPSSVESEAEGNDLKETTETEVIPETLEESDKCGSDEQSGEVQSATEDADINADVQADAIENQDRSKQADEAEEYQIGAESSMQVNTTVQILEDTPMALLPVYSESQPSTAAKEPELVPESQLEPEDEDEDVSPPGGAENVAAIPCLFQEVPLTDPQENHRLQADPGEEQALLSQTKPFDSQTEPPAINSQENTETHIPARAHPEGESEASKRKTCQCCSIM